MTATRQLCQGLLLAVTVTMTLTPTVGQQVERRIFAIGPALKQNLDAHQLSSTQIESIANGVVEGLATGNVAPILDQTDTEVRVTVGDTNKTVGKDELASYVKRLLATPRLKEDVLDNDEVVIKEDEVGLARGTFWIRQRCLDDGCTKKKSSIVTINLP